MVLFWFIKKDPLLMTIQFKGICLPGYEKVLFDKFSYFVETASKFEGIPNANTDMKEISEKIGDLPRIEFMELFEKIRVEVCFELVFQTTEKREMFLKSIQSAVT